MKARSTGSGGFRTAYYTDDEFMYDDDMDYVPPARKKPAPIGGGGKERPGVPKRPAPAQSPPPGAGGQSTSPGKAVRSRPTNNQLLYKAYFRWAHYPHKLKNANLPVETDACASVTAAFLQVLQIMQTAEQLRHGNNKRNVLQILSSNTRRTKVVELSSGTHRVPDELKKHYLSDGEGGQYSTNLDRNRYGNDDNYLFTVIRYDLEFLGLCPCMVDVEIIDAKQGNTSIIVSAGTEVCTCQGGPPMGAGQAAAPVPIPQAAAVAAHHHHPAAGAAQHHHVPPASTTLSGGGGHVAVKAEYQNPMGQHVQMPVPVPSGGGNGGYGGGGGGTGAGSAGPPDIGPVPAMFGSGAFRGGLGGGVGRESPKRSGTSVSQLFDALVMAATGGADGAAAAGGLGGEPPVTSPAHADRPERGLGGMGGIGGGMGAGGAPRQHGPPGRNKSKLWSLNNLSYGGEVDSLQNALDAFREQDEIASVDPAAAFLTGSAGGPGGLEGSLQRSDSLRQRRRKPLRNSSILGRPASSGGVAPLGNKMAMNLREKSDDNLKLAADADLAAALAMGAGALGNGAGGMGPGASFQAGGVLPGCGGLPHGSHHHHLHHGATQVSSLASGEDDNEGGGGDADGDEALAAKGEDLGVEGEGEAGVEEEGQEEGAGGGMVMGAGRGGAGGDGLGPTASGTVPRGAAPSGGRSHHVRHVPRQSSVANLGPRVANSSGGGNAGGNGAAGGGGPGASGLGPLGNLGLGLLGPGGLGGSASAAIAGEQLRRLANELEVTRQENRSLRQQLQRANSTSAPVNGNGGGGGGSPGLGPKQTQQQQQQPPQDNVIEAARLRKLEAELSAMRSELMGLSGAKKTADEENKQLKRELLASQQQVATLLSRMLGATAVGGLPGLPSPAAGGLLPSAAGLLASLLGPGTAAPAAAPSPAAAAAAPAQQPMLGGVAGAYDPGAFTAHFAALRQTSPQQLAGAEAAEVRAGGHDDGADDGVDDRMDANGAGGHPHPQHPQQPPPLLQHHSSKKRTAEEADIGATGPGQSAEAHEAAAVAAAAARRPPPLAVGAPPAAAPPAGVVSPASASGRQPQSHVQQQQQQLHQHHHHAQHHQQQHLPSMPSFGTSVPPMASALPGSLQQQQQVGPVDSGAAATPADSFSDVAQLLALPNLDGGYTASELGSAFGGISGAGGALAASSGPPAHGSGSGSGTASVPQMPQPEHQQGLRFTSYERVQQHAGLR